MKKRILALICAAVMTVGMSMTVCAAGSPSAGAAATEELTKSEDNTMGQVITTNTIGYFAETTTVEGVAGAKLEKVSDDTAKGMISEAQKIAGKDTFIASIVDLQVPAGTGAATFTVGCPNVWKGQSVTILHKKSDGTYERIAPSKVEDNKVTFTMTSYSPIAIVINTSATAPKTGDIFAVVAAMAALSGLGAVACGKKAKKN